ncbi:MAG: iron ABC transporter permease [Gemmatimonadaceae bacterium]|jgi:iron complex transport system permease protein|nr:iron ABC transporter permease [Gemmatimonadaceae bacterium]
MTAAGDTLRFGKTGRARRRVLFLALSGMAPLAVIAALCAGALPIAPTQLVRALATPMISPADIAGDPSAHILWALRLPRALLAFAAGALLALGGCCAQGVFRNPLADPGLLGISSGASVAAATAIVLLPTSLPGTLALLSPWLVPGAAFAGAMTVTTLLFHLSRHSERPRVQTLLLSGIAVNALCFAAVGALITIANDAQLRTLSFWTLGSVAGATWTSVGILVPICAIALVLLLPQARALDALLLGEREARHVGIDVPRVVRRCTVGIALGVGGTVALTGLIGFVGLIVPHLLRSVLGPGHRALLPGSVLGGGLLLLLADTASRTVVAPIEVPVGVLTATIGGPLFLALLQSRREQP